VWRERIGDAFMVQYMNEFNARCRNKYHAVKTTVDGISFDSRAEAGRYGELKMLERAGKISGLILQPEFILVEKTSRVKRAVKYIGDFKYCEGGETIVEDVKGFKTPVYALKRSLFLSRYGTDFIFRENRNGKIKDY
jgi:hypothetical protein